MSQEKITECINELEQLKRDITNLNTVVFVMPKKDLASAVLKLRYKTCEIIAILKEPN